MRNIGTCMDAEQFWCVGEGQVVDSFAVVVDLEPLLQTSNSGVQCAHRASARNPLILPSTNAYLRDRVALGEIEALVKYIRY